MRMKVESGVSLTSCTGRDGSRSAGSRWESDWRQGEDGADSASLLQRLTHKGGSDKFREAIMALPHSWLAALTVLEALREGSDPVKLVRHRLKLDGEASEGRRADKTQRPNEYGALSMEKPEEEWMAVVGELERTHGIVIPSPGSTTLRHGAHVFLVVTWLATILKPILHHNQKQRRDGSLSLGKIGVRNIVLTKEQQQLWWKLLKDDGILEPELARVLRPDGLAEFVLPTLLRIGLAFSLPSESNGKLVVMLRLPEEPPQSVTEDLENIRHVRYAALRVSWKMPLGAPLGAIEKVLVRCCELGLATTFWRFGVQVEGDFGENDLRARFVVRSVYSRIDGEMVMEVFGNLAFAAPWAALSYIMSAMLLMTQEFPGLPWRATLHCPTHGQRKLDVSKKACKAGDNFFADGACGKCTSWTRGLGAFAKELLAVVDIITKPRSPDAVFQKVARRFEDHSGSYPALSAEGFADRRTGDIQDLRRFLRELTRDFIGAMETIGQRDALSATRD